MHTHESSVCVHTRKMHMHTLFLGNEISFLRAQNIIFWYGLAPSPLGTSKDILEALKTLILTYKYSPYVSNQNPRAAASMFFLKIQNLSLVSSKAEINVLIWFLKTFSN